MGFCMHGNDHDGMFCMGCRKDHAIRRREQIKAGTHAYFVVCYNSSGHYYATQAQGKPYKTEAAAERYACKLNNASPTPGFVVRHLAVDSRPAHALRGTVKWWNDSKGYGFLSVAGHLDVWAHYTAIQTVGFKTLVEGQQVEFTMIQGPKGPQAAEIYPLKVAGI